MIVPPCGVETGSWPNDSRSENYVAGIWQVLMCSWTIRTARHIIRPATSSMPIDTRRPKSLGFPTNTSRFFRPQLEVPVTRRLLLLVLVLSTTTCVTTTQEAPLSPPGAGDLAAEPDTATAEPSDTTVTPTPRAPVRRACCRVCRTGKACGNSCINQNYTCRQPPGCACNREQEVAVPSCDLALPRLPLGPGLPT